MHGFIDSECVNSDTAALPCLEGNLHLYLQPESETLQVCPPVKLMLTIISPSVCYHGDGQLGLAGTDLITVRLEKMTVESGLDSCHVSLSQRAGVLPNEPMS